MWDTVMHMANPHSIAIATLRETEDAHVCAIRRRLRVCGAMSSKVRRITCKGVAMVQVRVTGLSENTRRWIRRDVKRVHALFGSTPRPKPRYYRLRDWSGDFTFVFPLD